MPIYEYKCSRCSNCFSKLVISKDAKIECPECKSEDVQKQVSVISSSSGTGTSASGGCSSGFS